VTARTERQRIGDAVWESSLSWTRKLVMFAHLEFAGDGVGSITTSECARVTGLSPRTVRRAVRELETAGWVRRVGNGYEAVS
jgi:predicted transcriptional regulator of viral defense system